jgi:hypothetical protein
LRWPGHPKPTSNMTTWVNSQFPQPDFHRQVQRHYGLQTQILTRSDPKIRGQEPKTLSKRAHNPLWKEVGLTKPTAAHPSGPGGWGGDWYVWHTPDGLRARAATALGCVQAGTEKLGVIQASYASAIIGVLSPVSSHCFFSPHAAAQPWGGRSIHFLAPRKRGPFRLPGKAATGAW